MPNSTHGVVKLKHEDLLGSRFLDWDNLRLFLLVAETGSFRAASERSGHPLATIRRRMEELEASLNTILVRRTNKGIELTEFGRQVQVVGEEMTLPIRKLSALAQKAPGLRSTVRISATEGLGTFWIVPRVMDFYHQFKQIQVDLRCAMEPSEDIGIDVDIGVQLVRPVNPDLIVVQLGWLHVVMFASKEYNERWGKLNSIKDIGDHNYIDIVAPQIANEKLTPHIENNNKRSFVGLRVNTGSAQIIAAQHGAGIAALPTYTVVATRDLEHVAPDFVFRRDIWLVYSAKSAELPHVRKAIEWLKQSFDPNMFPWFREEYISPADLKALIEHSNMGAMFAKFREVFVVDGVSRKAC